MRHLFLFLICATIGFATLAQGKKTKIPALSPEAKAVEAAVITFFNAMRTSDSTLAKSVLAPTARLMSVGTNKEGQVFVRETPMNKFVEMIGQQHPKVLDERIWDVIVQIDNGLATLWCQYAFYTGDTFSHCGVDAIQLYRSKEGWKIFSITDTRRKEGCDLKAAEAAKARP